MSSFLQWKDARSRLLLALLIATWAGLMLKRQLNLRFFLTALPAASLLAAHSMLKYAAILFHQLRARRHTWLVAVLTAALAIYLAFYLQARVGSFPFLVEVAYEADPKADSARSWIRDGISLSPGFLINGWDQFSTSALNFYLASACWPAWEKPTVTDVLLKDPAEAPEAVEQFRQAVMSVSEGYLIHLGNTPVPAAGAWWAYQAALRPCWAGQWQAAKTFPIHLWDSRLKERILDYPLHYSLESQRLAARERYLYSLQMETKLAFCVCR